MVWSRDWSGNRVSHRLSGSAALVLGRHRRCASIGGNWKASQSIPALTYADLPLGAPAPIMCNGIIKRSAAACDESERFCGGQICSMPPFATRRVFPAVRTAAMTHVCARANKLRTARCARNPAVRILGGALAQGMWQRSYAKTG